MATIELTRGFNAQVDNYLYEIIVAQGSWRTSPSGYARHNARRIFGKRPTILMHRFIYELVHGKIPDELQIDHQDGNRLNNQLSNLCLATVTQQRRNVKSHGFSKYLGVSWAKPNKKWKLKSE